jgi:MFS family permease
MSPMARLVLLVALNHVCFTGVRFTATLYAIQLGVSTAMVGVVGATFAILPMLTSVFVGRIADRYGARRPLIISSAIIAAAGFLGALWPHVAALIIAGTLVGGFYNITYISAMQAAHRMGTPEQARQIVVNVSLAFGVTGFISPLAGGFAIDHFGHAATLFGFALVPLIPLVGFAANAVRLPPGDPAAARAARRGSALQLLADPALRRTYLALTALAAAWDVFNLVMPIHGTHLGLSASRIGMLFGAFVVGTFIVRFFLPRLYQHFTPWQVLLVSLAVAGVAYLGFIGASSMALLLPTVLLLGLALGAQLPVSVSLVLENAPAGRSAEAFGMRVALVTTSQTALPLTAGVLSAAAGLAPVFAAVAATLFVIGWSVRSQWKLPRGRPPQLPQPPKPAP